MRLGPATYMGGLMLGILYYGEPVEKEREREYRKGQKLLKKHFSRYTWRGTNIIRGNTVKMSVKKYMDLRCGNNLSVRVGLRLLEWKQTCPNFLLRKG